MYSKRFSEALSWAHDLHREQARKGTSIPYIAHLLTVAGMVIEQGADEDTAIAAVLHDAVEDAGGESTRVEIERRFGPRVAAIVTAVSDTGISPKPHWRERKEIYLASIPTMSPEALLIATADKLHNVRTTLADYRRMGDAVGAKFNAGRDSQGGVFATFLAAVEARSDGPTALLAELRQIDAELFHMPGATSNLTAGRRP